MPNGYLALILHAHLPYIRHPEHPDFLEEDWLFEGITETYLPLLSVLENLVKDNVDFRLTITLSPPLCEMFSDRLLKERYLGYLNKLVELSEREVVRMRGQVYFGDTAEMYRLRLQQVRTLYQDIYHQDLVGAFRKFQDMGRLEIITSGATHGYLPLMLRREAVRGQIKVAVNNYGKHFGRAPRGIWLPECGFKPGDDEILNEAGLKYFIVDTHGLLYGAPQPQAEIYAPVKCTSGVAAFGRDTESSRQVWSSKEGYPGDSWYREFYRDLGYDAPYDDIKHYLHSDGVRRNLGIKYYRITGKVQLHEKQPYQRVKALERVQEHAGNFMFNRQQQIRHLSDKYHQPPIVVAPYDAELFGHWWFEGPEFIDCLVRKIKTGQNEVALITPSEYLSLYPPQQVSIPSMSSWGDKGYSEVWLNGKNDWFYQHLHTAEDRMVELVRKHPAAEGGLRDALNQAGRELLLAQSSDWAFIMTTGTAEPYAQRRFKEHLARFNRLYDDITHNKIDPDWLDQIKSQDNIFSEMDYRVYT